MEQNNNDENNNLIKTIVNNSNIKDDAINNNNSIKTIVNNSNMKDDNDIINQNIEININNILRNPKNINNQQKQNLKQKNNLNQIDNNQPIRLAPIYQSDLSDDEDIEESSSYNSDHTMINSTIGSPFMIQSKPSFQTIISSESMIYNNYNEPNDIYESDADDEKADIMLLSKIRSHSSSTGSIISPFHRLQKFDSSNSPILHENKKLKYELMKTKSKILELENKIIDKDQQIDTFQEILDSQISQFGQKEENYYINSQNIVKKKQQMQEIIIKKKNQNIALISKIKNFKKKFINLSRDNLKLKNKKDKYKTHNEKLLKENKSLKQGIWSKKVKRLCTLENHTKNALAVSYNNTGAFIISGGLDKRINIWDMRKNIPDLRNYYPIIESNSGFKFLEFSPTEENIFVSVNNKNVVQFWDLNKCTDPLTSIENKDKIIGINFSPNGKNLAVSFDKKIKIWDRNSKKVNINISCSDSQCTSICYSYNGQTLASASDKSVKIYDLKKNKNILRQIRFHNTNIVYDIDYSPVDNKIAVTTRTNTVKIWNVLSNNKEPITQFKIEEKNSTIMTTKIKFNPDSTMLALVSLEEKQRKYKTKKISNKIRLYNSEGKLYHTLSSHSDMVNDIDFRFDNKYMVTCSADKTVKVWKTVDYKKYLPDYINK